MSALKLATEAQCLGSRLHGDLAAHASDLLGLVDQLGLALHGVPGIRVSGHLDALKDLALCLRRLEFDAQRLHFLADEQAADQRNLYSQTMEMVDAIRVARGRVCRSDILGIKQKRTRVDDLADALEPTLAGMQDDLRSQFPGETHPGD